MRIVTLLAALTLITGMVAGCAPRDTRTLFIVDNQSECGTIAVRFEGTSNTTLIRDRVPLGERREYVVPPGEYKWIIDFTAGGEQPGGFRCTAYEDGIIRIQDGQKQVWDLRSRRQTQAP